MKKAKSALSIVAIVLAALALVAILLYPLFIGLIASAKQTTTDFGKNFLDNVKLIFGNLKNVFDFKGLIEAFKSSELFTIVGGVLGFAVLILGIAAIPLFVVALVLLCVKKQPKALGLIVPAFVVVVLGALVAAPSIIPTYLNFEDGIAGSVLSIDLGGSSLAMNKIFGAVAGLLSALASLAFVLAMIFAIVYAASIKVEKPVEAAAVVEEVVVEEEPVVEAPVEEAVVAAAVAAEPAPAPVVSEPAPVAAAPAPTKVVRRILVHRSGKVVRVLNEHYYDVTTNIYVEPGYVDASMPLETEQQHYEKIINASAQPAPAPAPAPVAPAPVKVAPAPAPAPVVAPAVKAERIPFAVRMKRADKALKSAYNEIKSEILSYGIKSRISISGDTFRLHTKTYVKLVIAGKSLKLYFALSPKAYKDSTFPIGDASGKVAHKETPLVFKVKSDLSVRRAKILIADCAAKDGLVQGEVVKHDHAKEVK